jgi:hypothetical protein
MERQPISRTVIVSHGGGVPGVVALSTVVPEKKVAFALFTTTEEPGAD